MRAKSVLGWWLGAVAWLTSAGALAYSTDNHELLTREAVRLAKACKAIDASYHEDTLVDFNLRQDQLLRKARLWHFPWSSPRPGCDPCQSGCYTDWCPYAGLLTGWVCDLAVFRAFDPWVNALAARSAGCLSEADLPRAIGALLHYLQDLAVPPHAVPVFHPTTLSPFAHDEFDNYGFAIDLRALLAQRGAAQVCERVKAPGAIAQLLLEMREATLKSLQTTLQTSVDGRPQTEYWSMFWPRQPAAGQPREFGRYGCGDDQFGNEAFECDGKKYLVARGEYASFAAARAGDAIIASARLITLLHMQHPVSARAACASSADGAAWLPSQAGLEQIRVHEKSRCAAIGSDLEH